MQEDEIYRSSTQYRLWSFTEDTLRSIRANTNAIASDRVRAAVHRAREARQQTSAASSRGVTPNPVDENNAASTTRRPGGGDEGGEKEIECLTPDEELELVQYYCEKTMELGDEYKPPLPTTVRVSVRTNRILLDSPFRLLILSLSLLGHSYPIPSPFLSYKFSHDLSPKIYHAMRPLPRNQDG